MGIIGDRIADIARRCGDLSPIQDDVRRVLIAGNRRDRLAGLDVQGRPFAPLAPSTWRNRRGSGPPLAPRGAQSRVVSDYVVQVTAGPGRLTFAASWPGEPWMEYHHTGTRRMPRRDTYGFADHELYQIRGMLSGYVMQGSTGAGASGAGGGVAATISAPISSFLGRGRRIAASFLGAFRRTRRGAAGA